MASVQQTRPTGVAILAVIQIVASVSGLLAGLGLMALAGAIGVFGAGFLPVGAFQGVEGFLGGFLVGAFLGVVGISLAIIGVVGFIIAWGLWTGRSWAWTATIIFAVIGIISALVTLPGGIVGLILNGLILYYLTRPAVKGYFGKSPKAITV